MQKIIEQIGTQGGRTPRLLLHSCCAPCSSHCMEYLREHFLLTVFYYNPNITVTEEYRKRLAEEKRLIAAYNRQVEEQDFAGMHSSAKANPIEILEAPYDPDNWFAAVEGLEDCPEGGQRSISPLKDAQRLNAIGLRMGEEYGVTWLPSDFKKKDGYKRSIELSDQFGLYRQNYCGCIFSQEKKN